MQYTIEAGQVWSTLPISLLTSMVRPAADAEVLASARQIETRAMILVYLVLAQAQFTEYDAHYFPEEDIRISRLSEPKNYSGRETPENQTVLCAELPCALGSEIWNMDDEALVKLVCTALERAGLPVKAPVVQVTARRLPHAYPVYRQGFENHFHRLDDWVSGLKGILTFGRQGLFAHDNTHHALFMAYRAADCLLDDGEFDHIRWQDYRRIFETHVVED
jgi:protoporphyrinogen oxidase